MNNIPAEFILYQNYPNPFNPSTTISYELKNGGYVTLSVYDINGKLIKSLINKEQEPGKYTVNYTSSESSSGIYFYKLSTGSFSDTKKMILLK